VINMELPIAPLEE